MSVAYFLTSSRLGFRRWTEDDLVLAVDLWGDPRVTRLIDSRGRLSEEQVLERLLLEIATEASHGIQYWPIFLLGSGQGGPMPEGASPDRYVGCCGLRPYDPARGVLEIGVQLGSTHWGRGYATEAGGVVMAHAFGPLAASALFAGHHPDNEASRNLLRRLGFRHTHEELYEATGASHPSYLLTAEEYAARPEAESPCSGS